MVDKFSYDARNSRYEKQNLSGEKGHDVLKANTNEDIELFGDEEIDARRAELDGMKTEGRDIIATDRGRHSGISFDFMYGDKSENGHGGLMRYVEAGIFEDYTEEGFTRSDAQNLGNKMNEIEKRNRGKNGYIIKGQTNHFDGKMQLGDGRHYSYEEYIELAEAAGYRLKDPDALRQVVEEEVVPESEIKPEPEPEVKPEAVIVPEKTEVETDNGIYVVEWETETVDGNGTVNGKITAPDGNTYNVSYNVVAAADGDPDEGDIVAEFEKETQVDDQGNEKVINNTLNITVNGQRASKLTEQQIVQLFEKASAATDMAAAEHDRVLNGAPVPTAEELKKAQDAALGEDFKSEDTTILDVLNTVTDIQDATSPDAVVPDNVVAPEVDDNISDQEWLDGTLREFAPSGPSIETTRDLREIETDISRQIYNLKENAKVQKRTGFLGLGGKKTVQRDFTPEEQNKYNQLIEDQKLMNTLITYSSGMSQLEHVEVDPNDPMKSQQYQRVVIVDQDGNQSYRFVPSNSKHEFTQQLSQDTKNGTVSQDLVFYGATVVEDNGKLKFVIDHDNVLEANQVQSYRK